MNRKISAVVWAMLVAVAVAFGKKSQVIGYDINPLRIEKLSKGLDATGEVNKDDLKTTDIVFTTNSNGEKSRLSYSNCSNAH